MKTINLWELLTTAETEFERSNDRPAFEKAAQIVAQASKSHGFGNELSLAVDDNGTWTVKIFNCYNADDHVEMRVTRSGGVSVTRKVTGAVEDTRTVRF